MTRALRLLPAVLAVACCAACRTPVVADARPAPTRYDVWTTPPPGEDAPRLTRAPAPGASGTGAKWSADAEVSFLSRYAWRGQLLTDDPVFQPAANIGYGDWRFNVWANLDLTGINGNGGQFNEVDLTLEWLHAFEEAAVPFRLFAGAIVYVFPNTALPTTTEIYGGFSLVVPGNPTLTLYRDVDEIDGTYAAFDVHDEVALGDLSLHGRLGIGWGERGYNRGYFGVSASGWNDFHAVLAAPWTCGRFTVKPFVMWQSMVAGRIRAATAKSDLFVAGLTVGATL